MEDWVLTLYDEQGNPIPIPAIQGVGIKEIRLKEEGETEDTYEIVLDDKRVFSFHTKHGDDYVLTDADKAEIAEEAAKLVEIPGEESYRLLKTITVTEAVEEISETYPVGYEGVIVTVENITLASGSLRLYVTAGKGWITRGVGASLQTNSVLRFVCRKLNGTWDVFGYQGLKGDASTMIGQISAQAISAVSDTVPEGFVEGFNKINKIRVYSYSGYTLPVGMTIKIFVLGGDDNA